MAVFNERYGWEWNGDERRGRQLGLRRARNLLSQIREQARRVGQHVPQFKGQAEDALRQLEQGLRQVEGIDLSSRGKKYHVLSPQEFDCLLAAIPELRKAWDRLVSSPEYIAAVREANRQIHRHNKVATAHNRVVAAQQEAMFHQLDDVMRLADKGDIAGALDLAAKKGLL